MAAREIWIPPFDDSFFEEANPLHAMLEVQRLIDTIPTYEQQRAFSAILLNTVFNNRKNPAQIGELTVSAISALLVDQLEGPTDADLCLHCGIYGETNSVGTIRNPIGKRGLLITLNVDAAYTFPLDRSGPHHPTSKIARIPVKKITAIELGEAA